MVPVHAEALFPYISNGPLIFWLYPLFGIQGTAYIVGIVEWMLAVLLFLGFWNGKLGILGALGSCLSCVATLTMLPRIPDAWDAFAGGFPVMTVVGGYFVKDLVLLAASFYLLRQDVARVTQSGTDAAWPRGALRLSHGRPPVRTTAGHGSGTAA